MSEMSILSEFERRPVPLPEGRHKPDRQSRADRLLHQRARAGGIIKTTGGPNVLVVVDDPLFCSGLSHLAEAQHLPISFFWSAADVERAPFWSFDVVIIEAWQWDDLQRYAGPHLAAALGRTPIVVVDSRVQGKPDVVLESRFPMTIYARIPKTKGPAFVLEQAMKALSSEPLAALPSLDVSSSRLAPASALGELRLALIDESRHFSNALWTVAHERQIHLDLYADVAHFQAHAHDHHYSAVILDFDLNTVWGLEPDLALSQILGDVPAVIVSRDEPVTVDGAPMESSHYVQLRKSSDYDAILDAALQLAAGASSRLDDVVTFTES